MKNDSCNLVDHQLKFGKQVKMMRMNTETLIYNAQILIGSARAGPGSTYAISIGNRACAAGWPWLAGSIVLTCFGVDLPW